MNKNNIISHVQQSILWAENHNSKLSPEILNIEGQSSYKIRHFLNNLMEFPDINYLEIGLLKGSTFISSLYKNYVNSAYAMDIEVLDQFRKNCDKFNIRNHNIIESDCWKFDPSTIKNKINVFLYDGDHTYEDQYRALRHYYPILDDVFIFLVDDWTFYTKDDDHLDYYVERATRDSIRNLKLNTAYEKTFGSSGKGNDINTWWNGYYIGILEKTT